MPSLTLLPMAGQVAKVRDTHPFSYFAINPLSISLFAFPLQKSNPIKSFPLQFYSLFFTPPRISLHSSSSISNPNSKEHLKAFIFFSSYHNHWIWIASLFVGSIAKDLVGDIVDHDLSELV